MVEKIPVDAGPPVIRVVHVSRNFNDTKAIDDLSVELYRNQITVLLGHNGAGKTTLMNLMTGLFPPDRGDIFINGHSITKATEEARKGIGLCPQHNVLFDYLTVGEHLRFFGQLKTGATVREDEVDEMLHKVGLLGKEDDFPAQLTGGMMRKLSLANAAIGGSEVRRADTQDKVYQSS